MQKDEKIDVLTSLIPLIEVLQGRFRVQATSNQLKAAMYSHRELLRGETITISDVVEMSGVAKSTVSNMLKRAPHVILLDNPRDDRSKIVTMDDVEERTQYLVDVDRIWRRQNN